MKTLFFYFIFVNCVVFSQIDTLCIENKKYSLHKVKISYSSIQNGPVRLPMEYSKSGKKVEVPYNKWSNRTDEDYFDDDGNEIRIGLIKPECSCDSSVSNEPYWLNVMNFVDTIFVDVNRMEYLQPYIKTKTTRHYFCAASILQVKDGIVSELKSLYAPEGNIFSFWHSYGNLSQQEIDDRKATIYILRDLYYTKKQATYFLDRQFIILVTNKPTK